jgi:simple sugar transport system ATP-binding protein
MPIWENLIMKEASYPPFSRLGVLSPEVARQHCDDLREGFDIRAPTSDVLMGQLSGGNQQKTVLARELSRNPRILVAAHPTRGLDVGAMEFVYTKILSHRQAGGGTLLISHELDEILSLSDRIAVMVEGRFVRIVDAENVDLQALGLLMAGETVSE